MSRAISTYLVRERRLRCLAAFARYLEAFVVPLSFTPIAQGCARGMFQKSVVVVSRYPYVNLFERLVKVSPTHARRRRSDVSTAPRMSSPLSFSYKK